MNKSFTQRLLGVLWPAFLVAAVAELLFFAVFDPVDLHFLGAPVEAGRLPIYTLGFFFFWAVTTAASALTVFLQRPPLEVNRSEMGAANRPPDSL
jgi:hypothetical protein